jgi:serine/threonine protein kinase
MVGTPGDVPTGDEGQKPRDLEPGSGALDAQAASSDDSLPLESQLRLERLCTAFEQAWKLGQPTTIESILVDSEEPWRSTLLRELLVLDVDYRRRRGEKPVASDYAERFPEDHAAVAYALERAAGEAVSGDRVSETASGCPDSPVRSTPFAIAPGGKIDRFTVLRELGRGAFGMVYLARDEELQRDVAIKIPHRDRFRSPEHLQRFMNEARTAANLKHDRIVPIHSVVRDEDDTPIVVMEYLAGESLEATLGRGQLTFRQIAELLADIAEAVHFAHRRGIVHRDLKPSNILFDSEGKACITDFGLAERWASGDAISSADEPALAGTARFIPPEIYSGRGRIGPKVDVYALGVILYQALTGRYPFPASNLDDLREQILVGTPPLPQEIDPNIPGRLQRVCLMAMEDQSHRYESAKMLADELRRFLEDREVLARPRRYDRELRGKLQNHYAAIHSWREQGLISLTEMDRLLRGYWFLLQADSPWGPLGRTLPWEAIGIRLGGWLVLLSTLIWTQFYYLELSSAERIASVGLPALVLSGVGWTLRYLGSRRNAKIFLGTGAILLPLAVAIILREVELPSYDQGPEWEMFGWLLKGGQGPSNLQFTIATAAFLLYGLFLLRHFPGKMFAIWLAIGVYVFSTGCLALCGMKEWLETNRVAQTLVCYLLPCLLLLATSLAGNRRNREREAAMLFVFFPVPFFVLMTLLAYYGSGEWLDVDIESGPVYDDQTINKWWMLNGLAYAFAAWLCMRGREGFIRFWSAFFVTLVPISLLLPCNLLFDQVESMRFVVGLQPLTLYEVVGAIAAIGFIVLGTVTNHATLSLPGLIGLTVSVFRFTDRHFPNLSNWPLCVALAGGVLMLAGVTSAVLRARERDRDLIPK